MLKPTSQGTLEYKTKTMPRFDDMKAFVLPGAFYGNCVALMAEAGFSRANTVEDADVVVFIGGADISPSLYGQKDKHSYGVSKERDDYEQAIYHECLKHNKPMFGICRGAQFLHAMNGGQLWQDVNGHAGPDHSIIDLDLDVRLTVTSLHHQMLQSNQKMEIVAVTENQIATVFKDGNMSMKISPQSEEIEIEAGAYSDTKCFFVQGHPEVGSKEYRAWTMTKLQDFMRDWRGFKPSLRDVVENMVG